MSEKHGRRLETLLLLADKQAKKNEELDRRLEALVTSTGNLDKQWQAYVNSLPRN